MLCLHDDTSPVLFGLMSPISFRVVSLVVVSCVVLTLHHNNLNVSKCLKMSKSENKSFLFLITIRLGTLTDILFLWYLKINICVSMSRLLNMTFIKHENVKYFVQREIIKTFSSRNTIEQETFMIDICSSERYHMPTNEGNIYDCFRFIDI
jgi:hypothetical protein